MKIRTRFIACLLLAALLLPGTSFAVTGEESERTAYRTLSDLTGEGTVIAVIAAGFDVTHPALAKAPASPALTEKKITARLGADLAVCYLSEKIPYARDYVGTGLPPTPDAAFIGTLQDGTDADVRGIADDGTPLATLAAGCYRGTGDTVGEDGKTVQRDGDYLGVAPEAQLLLMKAASDLRSDLVPEAVAEAIRDALTLGADVILCDLARVTVTEDVLAALTKAEKAGVPVYTGAGDMNEAVQKATAALPAALPEGGTLTDCAALPALVAVGALADPLAGMNYLLLGEEQISYTDSSADYLGKGFAAFFAGETLTAVPVPGFGREADFEKADYTGKIAVVSRGEIPFAEKAKNAADAGALGLIVVNTDEGTERMALTDTTVPGVMVSKTDGERLLSGEEITLTVPAAGYRAADFSARGLTGDFTAAVSFLTLGENLTAGVQGGYAMRTGTLYAAARAAGYYACAVQYKAYLHTDAAASALLAAAARPLDASPRTVGCGLLDGDCPLPDALLYAADGAAISVPEASDGNTFLLKLTLCNLTNETRTFSLRAAFSCDAVSDTGILTGETAALTGVTAFLPGGADLCTDGDTLTLAPLAARSLTLRVSLTPGTKRALSESFPYGFCIDGTLTLTEENGGAVTHRISFFCGDPAGAPLSDATVYGDETPLLAATGLTAVSVSGGFAMPLGAKDPFDPATGYDEAFNLVNPRALAQNGALQLKLTALREIASVRVRVTDAEGRTVHESESGPYTRYLVSGARATVPLWDFTADDEPQYVFPDGEYTLEITLTAAPGGGATETLTFPLTADSSRPTLTGYSFTDSDDGRLFLTLTAADNTALREITVYDLARRYESTAKVSVAGEKAAEVTFEITAYDGESPLYLEITDYAGSSTVRRFTLTDVARFMEGQAEE